MDNFFGNLVYGRNNRYRSIIAEGSLIPILITPDFVSYLGNLSGINRSGYLNVV